MIIVKLRSTVDFPQEKVLPENDMEDSTSLVQHNTKCSFIRRYAMKIKIAFPWYFLRAVIFVSCLSNLFPSLIFSWHFVCTISARFLFLKIVPRCLFQLQVQATSKLQEKEDWGNFCLFVCLLVFAEANSQRYSLQTDSQYTRLQGRDKLSIIKMEKMIFLLVTKHKVHCYVYNECHHVFLLVIRRCEITILRPP